MSTKITVIGGNLFAVAAEHLGDALQWINIAQINNIKDPMLSGQVCLFIPTSNSAFADGIAPQ